MTQMRVKGMHREAAACHAVVILETSGGDRALAFTVPMSEAERLARALGLAPGRTPIHDLVLSLAHHLEAVIVRAVIAASAREITATLDFRRGGDEVSLACHPADALTLATCAHAPIFATAEALSHACPVPVGECRDMPQSTVAQWLARVRPGDFVARDDNTGT